MTGAGVICSQGKDGRTAWEAVLRGEPGGDPITRFPVEDFPVRFAAQVKGFDAAAVLGAKEARRVDLFIAYGVAAVAEAIASSRLKITPDNAGKIGVNIGSGIGGLGTIEDNHSALLSGGWRKVSPFFVPASIINMASGYVSMIHGIKGPSLASVSACASAAHAIGESLRAIRHGEVEVMIAGGAESPITPLGVGGFAALRALSRRNEEPKKASRPWDKDRDGFVLGEGAGVLVLESLEHALERDAPILAEISGYAATADAYHITAPPEDGNGAARAMQGALMDAGISADAVDYVNAHGTSTPMGDLIELKAIKTVFGEHAKKLLVSSTKSMTGHALGASGGIEAAFCIFALKEGIVPPTINLDVPDEGCDLDFVPHEARRKNIRIALSNSFGFGGTNATLVFSRFEP